MQPSSVSDVAGGKRSRVAVSHSDISVGPTPKSPIVSIKKLHLHSHLHSNHNGKEPPEHSQHQLVSHEVATPSIEASQSSICSEKLPVDPDALSLHFSPLPHSLCDETPPLTPEAENHREIEVDSAGCTSDHKAKNTSAISRAASSLCSVQSDAHEYESKETEQKVAKGLSRRGETPPLPMPLPDSESAEQDATCKDATPPSSPASTSECTRYVYVYMIIVRYIIIYPCSLYVVVMLWAVRVHRAPCSTHNTHPRSYIYLLCFLCNLMASRPLTVQESKALLTFIKE